jgi:hypothetical protein
VEAEDGVADATAIAIRTERQAPTWRRRCGRMEWVSKRLATRLRPQSSGKAPRLGRARLGPMEDAAGVVVEDGVAGAEEIAP